MFGYTVWYDMIRYMCGCRQAWFELRRRVVRSTWSDRLRNPLHRTYEPGTTPGHLEVELGDRRRDGNLQRSHQQYWPGRGSVKIPCFQRKRQQWHTYWTGCGLKYRIKLKHSHEHWLLVWRRADSYFSPHLKKQIWFSKMVRAKGRIHYLLRPVKSHFNSIMPKSICLSSLNVLLEVHKNPLCLVVCLGVCSFLC